MGKALSGEVSCPCDRSCFEIVLLTLVLEGTQLRTCVAHFITGHEQIQLNRFILLFSCIPISKGSTI